MCLSVTSYSRSGKQGRGLPVSHPSMYVETDMGGGMCSADFAVICNGSGFGASHIIMETEVSWFEDRVSPC